MDVSYLFVYGTLLDANNVYGDFLKRNSEYITEGSFHGKLYHIGEYPGAHYIPEEKGKVYGSIVAMTDENKVLRVLDDYEGFGFSGTVPNEFTREFMNIDTANGDKLDCWVYLFNLPVTNFKFIPSGRWKDR